jgi:hypothetical protein
MGNLPTRPFRTWQSRVTILAVAMVLASVGASLAQAADGGAVVLAGGAVAGHGCASWLAAANRIFFADGGSPPLRQTLHARPGGRVPRRRGHRPTDQVQRIAGGADLPPWDWR